MAALPLLATLPAFWGSWAALPACDVPRRWGKRGSTGGVSRRRRALPTADGRRWRLEGGLERVDVHVDPFPRLVGRGRLAVRIAVGVVDKAVRGRRRARRRGMPQAAVPQNLLDHRALRRLDEGDHLHLPPHLGQASGSTSYTRLMSMAQVWLQRCQRADRWRQAPGLRRPPEWLPCGACRGPCCCTSRNSESDARPWAECVA